MKHEDFQKALKGLVKEAVADGEISLAEVLLELVVAKESLVAQISIDRVINGIDHELRLAQGQEIEPTGGEV